MVAILTPAAPAQAASYDDCPADRVCLYSGSNGAGKIKEFTADDNGQTYTGAWDNRTRSVKNNTRSWVCVYSDPSYGGALQTIKPGAPDDYTGTTFVATAGSHKLEAARGQCFTGYERCPEARLCLFDEPGGRGEMLASPSTTPTYPATWPGTVKSVANRTGRIACLYRDPRFAGTWPNPGGKYNFTAFVVLDGFSVTVPQAYTNAFRSHELVDTTKDCLK